MPAAYLTILSRRLIPNMAMAAPQLLRHWVQLQQSSNLDLGRVRAAERAATAPAAASLPSVVAAAPAHL